MTEEELTAIEARHTPSPTGIQWYPTQDVHTLVAEVRRLRALVKEAYIEAAFDAARCWGDTPREREEILAGHESNWLYSDAFKALEAA